MKSNELRIGNYVFLNNEIWSEYSKIPLIVTKLDSELSELFPLSSGGVSIEHEDKLKNLQFNQYNEYIEPIPLTEKWLLKAGFVKVGMNYQKDWILLWTYLKTGEVHFVLNEPNSNKRHITELKYVHQLQNLYFALEGSEIIFSNKP